MNYLQIKNNKIVLNNIGNDDIWSFYIIDGNFMLSKYNGIGLPTEDITIIPFPNMGDGIYGDIVFYVNNKKCYNGDISSITGEAPYFSVSPKNITLRGENTTQTVIVTSNCEWYTETNSDNFTIIKGSTNFIIQSKNNKNYENEEIIVKNCDNLTEIVNVSQIGSQTSKEVLEVSPQYINLKGENKSFTVDVISICNNSNDFDMKYNLPLILNKSNSFIEGELNTEESMTTSFTVSNKCSDLSKTVIVEYVKEEEQKSFMWIQQEGMKSVDCIFTSVTETFEYQILSSSNWDIIDYNQEKVNCSKNGNKIKISLSNDKSECKRQTISLRNREGNEVTVLYTIVDGLVETSGITFTFYENNANQQTITKNIRQEKEGDALSFTACVLAYDNISGEEINWKYNVGKENFKLDITELSGGKKGQCKTIKFTATEKAIKSKEKTYTLILKEQKTFKEISIKLTVYRPNESNKSSYEISISPTGGTFNEQEMQNFQVSVTPIYYFNNNPRYISQNNLIVGESYLGVSAITKMNETIIEPIKNGEDNLIYNLNIPNGMTSFTIYSSATTKNGSATTATTSATFTITGITEYEICEFKFDVYDITEKEVEIDSTDEEFDITLISKLNEEIIPVSTSCNESWVESAVMNENGQKLIVTVDKNETSVERNATIKITQNETTSCNRDLTLKIKQKEKQIVNDCMTIDYTVSGLDSAVTVYFKTTNSTQQGSHTVNANGNQSLCNIAEDTVLVVSCSDTGVTVGGDTEFTYKSGTTANISLNKKTKIPTLTGLNIQNNQPGNAKITITINNQIINNNDLLGTSLNQTYSYTFSGNSTIDILYETNQWKGGYGITSWVAIKFIGEYLTYTTDYSNNTKIDDTVGDNNEFWVYALDTSSCSGSIVTKNGDYTVMVNIIYQGYSQ